MWCGPSSGLCAPAQTSPRRGYGESRTEGISSIGAGVRWALRAHSSADERTEQTQCPPYGARPDTNPSRPARMQRASGATGEQSQQGYFAGACTGEFLAPDDAIDVRSQTAAGCGG